VRPGANRINRRAEIGVGGERLHHGRGIVRELGTEFCFQPVQMRKGFPGHAAPEVVPEPFDRIAFGAIGGQKHQRDIGRQDEARGRMHRAVIQHQHVEGGRIGGGEGIDKHLHIGRVELGQKQEKGITTGGRDRPITPTVRIRMLRNPHRFDAPGRDTATLGCQQAEPRFILTMDFDRQGAGRSPLSG